MGIVFLRVVDCCQVYTGRVCRVSADEAGRGGPRSLDRVPQIAPTWPTESGSCARLPGHLNDNESREDTMRELRVTLFGRCTCCPPPMGRREFLAGGIAALGLGAFVAGGRNAAASQTRPVDGVTPIHQLNLIRSTDGGDNW